MLLALDRLALGHNVAGGMNARHVRLHLRHARVILRRGGGGEQHAQGNGEAGTVHELILRLKP